MQYSSPILDKGFCLLSFNEETKLQEEQLKYKQFQEILNGKLLETYFQPIVSFRTGKNIGFEVFNRPKITRVFPSVDQFYDFVGQTKQYFMMDQVSHVLAMEKFSKYILHKQNTLLFLNTFPNTLVNYLIYKDKILQILDTYNISPEKIVFELSEKVKIEDYEKMIEVIDEFRSEGIRIALDDVGSGYNNLNALVQLKPDFIKMDKTFIQNIDQDQAKQQLIEILLDFSNRSHAQLVAEGIERMEELTYLKNKGVHIGQGYAIGKPSKEVKSCELPEILD